MRIHMTTGIKDLKIGLQNDLKHTNKVFIKTKIKKNEQKYLLNDREILPAAAADVASVANF